MYWFLILRENLIIGQEILQYYCYCIKTSSLFRWSFDIGTGMIKNLMDFHIAGSCFGSFLSQSWDIFNICNSRWIITKEIFLQNSVTGDVKTRITTSNFVKSLEKRCFLQFVVKSFRDNNIKFLCLKLFFKKVFVLIYNFLIWLL